MDKTLVLDQGSVSVTRHFWLIDAAIQERRIMWLNLGILGRQDAKWQTRHIISTAKTVDGETNGPRIKPRDKRLVSMVRYFFTLTC